MAGHEYDVIVLGTGAAGLMAAAVAADAGATVGLFEKADLIGGTTALSGGIAWLPAFPGGDEAGAEEDGIAYLKSLSNGMVRDDLVETFVRSVPETVEWLHARTPVRLRLVPGYPDYHPERPGGRPRGGRSYEPELISFHDIGEWGARIPPRVGEMRMLLAETPSGRGTGVLDPEELKSREARDINGLGRALIAGLLKSCLDHEVAPVTGARAERLLVEEGRVAGVSITRDGATFEARARHGVILATGGFEWDPELVRSFSRGPIQQTPTAPSNTGDGLRMAMRVGAMLGNMREAWWTPTMVVGGETHLGVQKVALTTRERARPGSIMVNSKGRRFTNEAANYNANGAAFHRLDPTTFRYENLPAWLIFDARHLRHYGFYDAPAGGEAPGWGMKAERLDDLEASLGLPAASLTETVDRWNARVEAGEDPDFGRGASAYDAFNGDRDFLDHRGTLGKLTEAPFYAVEIQIGALGTNGGPLTDTSAAVLDVDGQVIPGLYAAGNVMAAPTGMAYGGAGGTIGPALVWGYRAARACVLGCADSG